MKLTKTLAVIDTETTGVDPQKDRIITFAVLYITPTNTVSRSEIMVNPGIPIPPEATEIHGITDADVADKKPFSAYAASLLENLSLCDLCGYNLINFDVPLLWEEFFRCGLGWDLSETRIIDAGNIFKLKEPRDLSAAVRLYCNREHTGAHGAMADVEATRDVLEGQLARYADLPQTVEELAAFSRMDDRIDLAGCLVRGKDGEPTYRHKKVRGVKVKDDPGYASWILRSDFSEETKRHIRRILNELYRPTRQPENSPFEF